MVDLTYERRGQAVAGDSRSVVLIHGIGSRWQMWEPVLGLLPPDRDVIALDLPGFGSSPSLPPQADSGARSLAEAVAAFLAQLGVERPHLVGNSLGGWVALELARLGHASSVVCLSPAGFASRAESVWARSSLIALHRAARLIGPRAHALSQHAWFRRLGYWQLVAHPENVPADDVAGSTRALANATGFQPTLRATTRSNFQHGRLLGMPVTIAWGEKDRLLLPRQAARAAAELPGARLVNLPDCGHIPTYDDPGLIARVILNGIAED
ncbi:MAG TPA: alpha/beta fold hydrolase [Solirubrobacteraceae bacterium]|nr:alpha/beta fold hydrolase [Solirubrobacteraceae bacterium]